LYDTYSFKAEYRLVVYGFQYMPNTPQSAVQKQSSAFLCFPIT